MFIRRASADGHGSVLAAVEPRGQLGGIHDVFPVQENLEIRFPEGSLEHAATEQQVSLSYTDEVKALLQDWAIPDNRAYI